VDLLAQEMSAHERMRWSIADLCPAGERADPGDPKKQSPAAFVTVDPSPQTLTGIRPRIELFSRLHDPRELTPCLNDLNRDRYYVRDSLCCFQQSFAGDLDRFLVRVRLRCFIHNIFSRVADRFRVLLQVCISQQGL